MVITSVHLSEQDKALINDNCLNLSKFIHQALSKRYGKPAAVGKVMNPRIESDKKHNDSILGVEPK